MWPAPLLLELDPVLEPVAEVVALTVDPEVVTAACCVVIGLEVAAVAAAEEAVNVPLISCWTVELKVPVIPVRVNLAENASAGNWELLASFRLIDVNLIKY
jgi:hypothetical protein